VGGVKGYQSNGRGQGFFDVGSKLAADNIPANALDKIEVLRNFNEVNPDEGA